ncbi:MAG: amino acid ABC transporter permease [Planctomycetes bacterium]|nr:amino acid ABC transporter permease [Planctomycetota bacterium]MCD7897257.1 amino acid ABC transporter permease [Planctomycetaceae bacterium]
MINWGLIYHELGNLGLGALYTIGISICATVLGVAIGLTNSILRLSSKAWLRLPATIYLEAFRNTPMLVQILLLFYGVFPMLNLSHVHEIVVGCIALGLNSGAYLGEIFRGGILSIDRGQREAALSLGMSEYQSMRYIVLPQALTNALPALGNEFVTLIKDSSLLSVISVNELTYRAQLVGGRRFEYFTMYIGIGLIYFAICFTLSRYLDRVEKKMRTGQK